MKIAFIGQKGIPATFGGVERHVEELSTRLASRGHAVWVYCRKRYTKTSDNIYKGVYLIKTPTLPFKYTDAIAHTFTSILHLVSLDVDVVYVHSVGPSMLVPLIRILKPGVKVISAFHSRDDLQEKWGPLSSRILLFASWMACHAPHSTITISKGLKKYAKETLNAETTRIYNGVSAPKKVGSTEIEKKFGLKRGEYILVASRFVSHKGIHRVIKAFRNIKTSKKLVIAGDSVFTDAYTKQLKELAAGDDRIMFTGFVNGNTLWELFGNAYAFVNASSTEGLPISVLEAMSYGVGILVSNIPEHYEAAGESGFYFDLTSDADLEKQMRFILAHPEEVFARGGLAKKRTQTTFNWENITTQVEEHFDSLLHEDLNYVDNRYLAE